MPIRNKMYLGFEGRTFESLEARDRKVLAQRIVPYLLFPNSKADRLRYQAALSAARQVKLAKADKDDTQAMREELSFYAKIGGLAKVVEAESLATYEKLRLEATKSYATVAHVGLFFSAGATSIGRDVSKTAVFNVLAARGKVDGSVESAPFPYHHTNPSALKKAWGEREAVAHILTALFALVIETPNSLDLVRKPQKLIAKNYHRFVELLRWYAEHLTTTSSTKRKDPPITAEEIWILPDHLMRSSGKLIAARPPKQLGRTA